MITYSLGSMRPFSRGGGGEEKEAVSSTSSDDDGADCLLRRRALDRTRIACRSQISILTEECIV